MVVEEKLPEAQEAQNPKIAGKEKMIIWQNPEAQNPEK